MADELFNVVFRGDIVPGQSLPEVKQRFAQLFKLDAAKTDAYFTGKPVVLKKECDRATADKFKQALQQAGVLVDIKSVAPAPVSAPSQSVPQAAPVAPQSSPAAVAATPAPAPVASEASWSLSARGSVLIKPEEVVTPEPVKVSTDHIAVVKRNPFASDAEAPLEPARDVAPPPLDLSAYAVGKAGEPLVEYQEFVPLDIDLSAITLDHPGASLLREDEIMPVMDIELDLSDFALAPPGGDLGQIAPPPAPPPPSTDHLSVEPAATRRPFQN
ncbi:MAG TPA: hypothetical protein PLF22_11940 [Pseudomonadales bacterium]|nr:hypothetical protein [Pseudomonadales bacterium]